MVLNNDEETWILIGRGSPHRRKLASKVKGKYVVVYRRELSHNQVEVVEKYARRIRYE